MFAVEQENEVANSIGWERHLAGQETNRDDNEVFRFIMQEIDSVPQLEALLLFWSSSPAVWSGRELAQRLYVNPDVANKLLADLARKKLIAAIPGAQGAYRYDSGSEEQNQLMGRIDATYRREIVRISTMIHAKPSPAVRDFARAFRFTKEKE